MPSSPHVLHHRRAQAKGSASSGQCAIARGFCLSRTLGSLQETGLTAIGYDVIHLRNGSQGPTPRHHFTGRSRLPYSPSPAKSGPSAVTRGTLEGVNDTPARRRHRTSQFLSTLRWQTARPTASPWEAPHARAGRWTTPRHRSPVGQHPRIQPVDLRSYRFTVKPSVQTVSRPVTHNLSHVGIEKKSSQPHDTSLDIARWYECAQLRRAHDF